MTEQQRKLRDALYAANPHCPQCGVKMIHPREVDASQKYPNGVLKHQPDNLVTLEHTLPRGKSHDGNSPHRNKILCRKCNELNGTVHNQALQEKKKAKPVQTPKANGFLTEYSFWVQIITLPITYGLMILKILIAIPIIVIGTVNDLTSKYH